MDNRRFLYSIEQEPKKTGFVSEVSGNKEFALIFCFRSRLSSTQRPKQSARDFLSRTLLALGAPFRGFQRLLG